MSINIVENGVLKNVSGGGSAIRDGDGNVITDTYARKDHIVNSSVVTESGFIADARLLNHNNEDSPLRNLTLGIENVSTTNITLVSNLPEDPYFFWINRCRYRVMNGICTLQICFGTRTGLTTNSNNPYLVSLSVPPYDTEKDGIYFPIISTYPPDMIGKTAIGAVGKDGRLFVLGGEENIYMYDGCVTYPVKAN